MKGIVKITVTDKDGKVKTITQENKIFNIPKELIKNYISHADLGPLGQNNYSTDGVRTLMSPFACITAYAEWFRCIKVNDEYCSETDFKDWKYPVLLGGETTKQQTSNTRYSYIDTNKWQKEGSTLKKVWTWPGCPGFQMKSINLCHLANSRAIGSAYSIFTYLSNSSDCTYLRKYGKYYFSGSNIFSTDRDYFGNNFYYSYLATPSDFTWSGSYNQGSRTFNALCTSSENITSYSYCEQTPSIFSLRENNNKKEIAVFRYIDDMTTDDTNYYWKYLKIIDADTGDVLRSFSYSQFSEINYTSNYGCYNTYCSIIATTFGNFLIQANSFTTGASNYTKIWKLPDSDNSGATIELYATVEESNFKPQCYMAVINDYVIDIFHNCAIKINDDVSNPYTFYNYYPFNWYYTGGSGSLQSYRHLLFFSRYYDIVASKGYNFETWYNTTVLNLATPIDVSEGSTLNIEYTIVASNE